MVVAVVTRNRRDILFLSLKGQVGRDTHIRSRSLGGSTAGYLRYLGRYLK